MTVSSCGPRKKHVINTASEHGEKKKSKQKERTVFQIKTPSKSFGLEMTLRFIIAYTQRRHSSNLLFAGAPFHTISFVCACVCVCVGGGRCVDKVGVGVAPGFREELSPGGGPGASIGASMVGVASMHQ